jgi:hypothetical protein
VHNGIPCSKMLRRDDFDLMSYMECREYDCKNMFV